MKTLTTDELVTALRCCVDEDCPRCHVGYKPWALCRDDIDSQAADMLENHASDRAALVAEVEKLRKQLEQTQAERDAMRNELCYKCGNYREAHNGACDGCRWEKR